MSKTRRLSGFFLPALAAWLLACLPVFCPQAWAAAPDAVLLFPVGGQVPQPEGSMPPVAFDHALHKKWMKGAGRECVVCHHTGDPVACTTCHTVPTRHIGDYVSLYKAMHEEHIAPRPKNTPASCVSCHLQQEKARDCAGCHKSLVRPRREGAWCQVCHSPAPALDAATVAQGINQDLPDAENRRMARQLVATHKPVDYMSPMLAPIKVRIDMGGRHFGPTLFAHRRHVTSLMERMGSSRLAGAFHKPGAVCVTCHHNSPASATPPRCASCHSAGINPATPGKPALKAAYHLLCMTCHTDMQVGRPRNTDCASCHKPPHEARAPVKPASAGE